MQRRNLVLAGMAAPLAMSSRPTPAATAPPLLIGRIGTVHGVRSTQARAYDAGALMAFTAVNAAGGLAGRSIRWERLDPTGEPARVQALGRELLQERQALALFGSLDGAELEALEPLLRTQAIPAVGALGLTDAARGRCRGLGFFARASQAREAEALASHLAATGLQRVAIAHADSPAGQEGLRILSDALVRQRLQLAGSAALTLEEATAQEASRKLLALAPQAVVLFMSGSQAAAMMVTAAGLRRHPAFFGLSIVGEDESLRRIGPPVRGLALTQVLPSPWRSADRQMELYRQQARAAGQPPGLASLAGWIDAQVMIEALRRCDGQFQRERLLAVLKVMQLFVAGLPIDFSRQELGGSRFVDLVQLTESGEYLG
ncbi:MAG: hypothetical protein RLZZ592_944 [Pseudomonadota bacterium]|jgi:ABC-type branched-subunit amino acid transport system substrate-binding protein